MPLIDRLEAAGYLDSSSDEEEDPKVATKKGKTKKVTGKNNEDAKRGAKDATNDSSTLNSEKHDSNDKDSGTTSDTASTEQDTSDKDITSNEDIKTKEKIKNNGEAKAKDQAESEDDNSKTVNDTGTTTPDIALATSPLAEDPMPGGEGSDDEGYSSDMSELQIRRDERVRRTVNSSHGFFNVLGRADCLMMRSVGKLPLPAPTTNKWDKFGRLVKGERRPAAQPSVVELTYPTGDENAVDGFYLHGFKDGKRVYRLDSPLLPLLHSQTVKTAIGFCYIDIPAVCPPKIVEVPAEVPAEVVETAETADELVFKPVELSIDESAASGSKSSTGTPSDWSDSSESTAGSTDTSLNEAADETNTNLSSPQPILEVNGMFSIRPSALGGVGCFALRDISRGEHLLVERPLLHTNLHYLFHDLEALSPADRAQFDALHGWHPDPRASRAEQIWTANTFVAGELDGLFVVASRFNHACSRSPKHNVGYRYDRRHNVLVMTAVGRIAAGTELLISYGKSAPLLQDRFGFTCDCGACEGLPTNGDGKGTVPTADELYKRMWS
ncbi:hypothetical protein SEUCBS140593_000952 [Sporothrix eucalyptigena]|uniref:SET domain-containing protein n=1 Tax=Sporothrix eucalyptigena TaxID=1812306 RepID=A0ABP0AU81_9PEZI